VKAPTWLLAPIYAAACYRDGAQHPCDGAAPPAYCAASDPSRSSGTADTSSSSQPEPPDTTSTTHADSDAAAASSAESTSDAPATTDITTTTDTGAPAPFCGDGVVQPELAEECDDGDPDGDDGCNATCQRDRIIFVTSPPWFQGGELFGLKGADNYCVSRAGMAGLANPLRFRALLSDSTSDAIDRIHFGGGRYTLVDGTVIADSASDLFTLPLHHPLDLDELGQPAYVAAWTGTRHGTGRAAPGDVQCDDWANPDDLDLNGVFGWTDEIDATWIEADITNCTAEFALYCLEQK